VSIAAAAGGQRRLLMLIVLVAGAFILFFPAKQLFAQRDRIGSLEDRLVQLRAENDLLAQDVKRLENPDELEVLARERLGLVKPGERAYFVEPTKPKPTSAPEAAPQASWWERTWESFTSLLRGGD
jgi:cell division protein FtsB